MPPDPLVVLVNVDAPPSVLTRIRDIAPRITFDTITNTVYGSYHELGPRHFR
jgi:hypothetical protein